MTQDNNAQSYCPLSFTSHMYTVCMHWSQMCIHKHKHTLQWVKENLRTALEELFTLMQEYMYVCVYIYAYLRLSQNPFKVNQGHYYKPTDKLIKTDATLAR